MIIFSSNKSVIKLRIVKHNTKTNKSTDIKVDPLIEDSEKSVIFNKLFTYLLVFYPRSFEYEWKGYPVCLVGKYYSWKKRMTFYGLDTKQTT